MQDFESIWRLQLPNLGVMGKGRVQAEAQLMREQEEEGKRLDDSKSVECFLQSKIELLSRENGASM